MVFPDLQSPPARGPDGNHDLYLPEAPNAPWRPPRYGGGSRENQQVQLQPVQAAPQVVRYPGIPRPTFYRQPRARRRLNYNQADSPTVDSPIVGVRIGGPLRRLQNLREQRSLARQLRLAAEASASPEIGPPAAVGQPQEQPNNQPQQQQLQPDENDNLANVPNLNNIVLAAANSSNSQNTAGPSVDPDPEVPEYVWHRTTRRRLFDVDDDDDNKKNQNSTDEKNNEDHDNPPSTSSL